MPPSYDTLATSLIRDEQIYRIQLDRAEQNNTISSSVVEDLSAAVHWADSRDGIQGILLGSSDEAFCSGADLYELRNMTPEEGNRFLERYHSVIEHLRTTGKPTVASVQGDCVAGGQELALGCDLIIAEAGATFGLPEVLVGSTAAGGAVQMLPLIVGERRARELLLTGKLVSAEDAKEIGLVNRVVEDGDVDEVAADLLEEIVDNTSPQAYRVIKAGLNQWTNFAMMNWDTSRALTATVWASEEFQERSEAFLDKEPMEPRNFTGVSTEENR